MKALTLSGPTLAQRFKSIKEFLPKGRLSRWSESRHIFQHSENQVLPARSARWVINDYGERTRERWIAEYRHFRHLEAINQGGDYTPPQ